MTPSRRSFLSRLLASPLAAAYAAAARTAPPTKITRIETVYWKSREDASFWPHWTWVKIETDTGVFGIGETYPRNPAEAAVVHSVASSLIGHDPRDIERIWADLYRAFDFQIAGGAEIRALSAIDLALMGSPRQTPGGPRLPAHRRPSQSRSPPLQHLLPVQIRLEQGARKDHARAHR